MLTKVLAENLHIQFASEDEREHFEELYSFYGEHFIERLCESISYHAKSQVILYKDFYDLYEYNRQLWKIISNYIVIWEESLIALFAKEYRFKKGATKKIYHSNQVKRGELYVQNIERNDLSTKSNFYNNFEESFGVFRAICCNPDIRSEYNYPGFKHMDHIRNIDKLNKYRNNLIHNVYVIIDKYHPHKILKETIINKLNILIQYLPKFHIKTLLEELEDIEPTDKSGLIFQHYYIKTNVLRNIKRGEHVMPMSKMLSKESLTVLQNAC